jgi:small subunit ribosomal protein S6e
MKLIVSDPESGKSYNVEVPEAKKAYLLGKRMGEEVEGALLGVEGYSFVITGGSDNCGAPMRKDISGTRKMQAYLSGGAGFKPKRSGERKKKSVRGNEVSEEITQVNVQVSKKGSKPLEELIGKKEEKKE